MADSFTYIFYTIFMVLACVSSNAIIDGGMTLAPKLQFNYKKWGVGVVSFILIYTVVIGLRYRVGRDYTAYEEWYKKLQVAGYFPVDNEFGYVWLNKFLVSLHSPIFVLFIVIAFLQIFFLIRSLDRFRFLLPWYIFFFFTTLLFFSSMNIMRQTIAYFIFFYSIHLYYERKYPLMLLALLLGFSLHKSILMLVWVYPFLRLNVFKYKYIQIGALFLACFVLSNLSELITQKLGFIVKLLGYDYYLKNSDKMQQITKETSTGAGTGVYLFFLVDVFIIYHGDRLKEVFKQYHFTSFFNLYYLGALLEPIFASNFILSRTTDYLANFRVLMLSFTAYYMWQNKGLKVQRTIFGILCLALIFYFYRGIANSAANCAPFKFIF